MTLCCHGGFAQTISMRTSKSEAPRAYFQTIYVLQGSWTLLWYCVLERRALLLCFFFVFFLSLHTFFVSSAFSLFVQESPVTHSKATHFKLEDRKLQNFQIRGRGIREISNETSIICLCYFISKLSAAFRLAVQCDQLSWRLPSQCWYALRAARIKLVAGGFSVWMEAGQMRRSWKPPGCCSVAAPQVLQTHITVSQSNNTWTLYNNSTQ